MVSRAYRAKWRQQVGLVALVAAAILACRRHSSSGTAAAPPSSSAHGGASVATPPAPPPPPEKQMRAALTDDLAKSLLRVLHPTATLKTATSQVTCGPSNCTADWTLGWQGLLSKESTVITWTVTSSFDSEAAVKSESSSYTADQDMLKKLNDILGDEVADFGPRPTANDAGAAGSKLQVLANIGVHPRRFWRKRQKQLWAITPAGETDCSGNAMNQPGGTGIDASNMNQFQRREAEQKMRAETADLKAKAQEVAATLKAINVVFQFAGKVIPKDLATGPLDKDFSPEDATDDDEFPFVPYLSEYDFSKGTYTLLILAKKDGRWPIGANDPKIASKAVTASLGTRERTGVSVGGKEVTVGGLIQMGAFDITNRSRLFIPLAMSEVKAKSIADGADVSILIVERPLAAHFNKGCARRNVAGPDDVVDDGIGYVFSAETIGYEVRIGGELVASKQPD